jgi:N-acetylmuramoyl-L-alanine amidase
MHEIIIFSKDKIIMKGVQSMKKLVISSLILLIGYFSYIVLNTYKTNYAIAYSYGSKGDIVSKIQTKLKLWGYYTGGVDGIYGYNTYLAVKYFQKTNGLYPDGVTGDRTLIALGIYISNTSSTSGISQDRNLLGRLITGEARGEPYIGQVAVGGVIMNRTRDPRFPTTIPGVIYQAGAFTAVDNGQIDVPGDVNSMKAAGDALNGWDPSGGAIYYYNPATATSKWIWSRPVIKTIGHHVFCK